MVEITLETIGSHKPWVARITGRDAKYGLAREFVNGTRDYSGSNRPGTRGVTTTWLLDDGVYEICGGDSWGSAGKRSFARIQGDAMEKIAAGDVLAALAAPASPPITNAPAAIDGAGI